MSQDGLKGFPMLYEKDLDSVLQEIVARWGIPGLAVGIVQDDEIVYAKGFGVQSLETQTPVTLDSIFCVASVSKAFVATAVVQLAERGKINLDAPIVQYLPYFQLDDERYPQITSRQILSHTSGMPDMDESEYDELVHSFINFWGKAKLEAKRLDGLEALFQVGGGKLPGERLGDFLVVVLKS
jgi:CubicO group peptidase (beta-lactamase class C family)